MVSSNDDLLTAVRNLPEQIAAQISRLPAIGGPGVAQAPAMGGEQAERPSSQKGTGLQGLLESMFPGMMRESKKLGDIFGPKPAPSPAQPPSASNEMVRKMSASAAQQPPPLPWDRAKLLAPSQPTMDLGKLSSSGKPSATPSPTAPNAPPPTPPPTFAAAPAAKASPPAVAQGATGRGNSLDGMDDFGESIKDFTDAVKEFKDIVREMKREQGQQSPARPGVVTTGGFGPDRKTAAQAAQRPGASSGVSAAVSQQTSANMARHLTALMG